jgi:hypothetical protein
MSARSDHSSIRSPDFGRPNDRELDRDLSRAVDDSAARVADRVAKAIKAIKEAKSKTKAGD